VPGGIHVISFQRPVREGVADVIAWLRTYRPDVAIMVDLDDSMSVVDEVSLKRSVALADVLTTSTQALADKYGYDARRTLVIRDAIPEVALENPSVALSRKRVRPGVPVERCVGWTGVASNDLSATRGALANVVGGPVTFRSIGPREGLSEALGLPEKCIEVSGIPLPPQLHRVALGEIDVAIVPTVNQEAGSTKVLEFAAAGVPVIASDTPEHRALLDSGMPLTLVGPRKREWTKALKKYLALDDRQLKDLATAHRANVKRHHTSERRSSQWASAYRIAYQLSKEL
jgi:glycosyltransferase involved in cell wall biosynthesis